MGDTKWALVLQEKLSIKEVKTLLLGTGNFFEQMADVAIYNPQAKDHYSVLARDPSNEDEIKLMDIYKNGDYMFGNTIYPKNRLTVSKNEISSETKHSQFQTTFIIRTSKEKFSELQHSIEVLMLLIMEMVRGQDRK